MKKLVIVSADEIILYQPTILNLYSFLGSHFDVSIITFEPEYLGKARDESKNIIYIQPGKFKKTFFRTTDLLVNAITKRVHKYLFSFPRRSSFFRKYKAKMLADTVAGYKDCIFIAVDLMPLYVVQKQAGATHFLSLEIMPGDPYLAKIRTELISSVVIQSRERYQVLFNDKIIPTFFIQNAPMLSYKAIADGRREGLVWAGTVVKEFGVLSCFDFIDSYPQYSLVCKGAVEKKTKLIIEKKYQALLLSKKVILDSTYLAAGKFTKYLSAFRIGFCFYSWELIRSNINYETAPSGKLFMYLAAGVPVIAADISAFKFIEEFGAGVLVADYLPATIQKAVEKIEANHQHYSQNCYRAFEENCFDKNAISFRDFLLKDD